MTQALDLDRTNIGKLSRSYKALVDHGDGQVTSLSDGRGKVTLRERLKLA